MLTRYRMTMPGQGRGQPPYIYAWVQPISGRDSSIIHVFKLVHRCNVTQQSHELQWQMPILTHMMPETNVRGRSKLHE
ncbi:hypothetical protein [Paenibacillus sp. OK003]|uniref:hypothetical protein n=1 Tax=Paenibacillus sp. OK003 TaxID=1884380 RepID=UPI0008AB57A2|nr:hypothetical protein [Paenibacillus sp. OK003]SEL70911.1 hypothetical protein SAMN05518856_11658 [Paenibacillus sp. OK003]